MMKKRLLLLFLALITAFSFSGCFTKASPAEKLYRKVDRKMSTIDSYETEETVEMVFYVMGQKATGTLTGKTIVSAQNSDDYYYYSESETKINCDSLGLNQTTNSIKAFNDGKMFLNTKVDDEQLKLYSDMTKKDFASYQKEESAFNFDISNCAKSEIVENNDNTQSLIFSGFDSESISSFSQMTGLDALDVGADISDIELTIMLNEDLSIKQLIINTVFDTDETDSDVPVFKYTVKYSNYNNVSRITSTINTDDYDKIDCAWVIDKIDRLYSHIMSAKSYSFTIDVNQSTNILGVEKISKETDKIHFGKNDDGFFYDILADIDGTVYEIKYSNGTQTIVSDDETREKKQSESTAKAYISGLANNAKFDKMNIGSITDKGNGVYIVDLKEPNTSPFYTVVEGQLVKVNVRTQTIEYKIEKGKVVSAKYELQGICRYVQNGRFSTECSISITSENRFDVQ